MFGNEAHKEWTLSLYNAINGTNYSDSNAIEFNTIDDVIYMGMKNDISFLIGDEMNVFEHQSSYNPNMPVRQLMYLAKLYEGYISEGEESVYSSTRIALPTPKFIAFYNGTKTVQDETILKLSDSFLDHTKFDVEVKVRMININSDSNHPSMKSCKPLQENAMFIDTIRKGVQNQSLAQSIDGAIQEMPDDYEIKDIIIRHRAEVKGMILTEYNEEEEMRKIANSIRKSVTESVTKSVTESVTKSVTKSVTESVTKETANQYTNAAVKALMKQGLTKEEAENALKEELDDNHQ